MAKTLPWKVKIAALRKFKELEGHTMVRQSYVDPDTGFRLGRWVANIRQRSHFLNDTQLQDLEEIGFCWSRFKVLPWDAKIDMLHRFKQKNGHLLVAKDYVDTETGFHLGWWVDRMRQAKTSMNKARLQDLEDIGFVWNAFDASWDAMFNLLREYKQEHQHVCPKINEHYRGRPLGHWVGMQRQLYSRKMRSPEQAANKTTVISHARIAKLEGLGGFVWRLRTSGSVDYEHTGFPGSTTMVATEDASTKLEALSDAAASHPEHRVTPSPSSFQTIDPIPFVQQPPQGPPQQQPEHDPHCHSHHRHPHYQHRHQRQPPHHHHRQYASHQQHQYPHYPPQAPFHFVPRPLPSTTRPASHDMPLAFRRMEQNARSA